VVLRDGGSLAPESSRGSGGTASDEGDAWGASVLRRVEGEPQASNLVPSTTRFLVTRSHFPARVTVKTSSDAEEGTSSGCRLRFLPRRGCCMTRQQSADRFARASSGKLGSCDLEAWNPRELSSPVAPQRIVCGCKRLYVARTTYIQVAIYLGYNPERPYSKSLLVCQRDLVECCVVTD